MEEKSYDQRRERLLELVRSKRLKALQQELEEMKKTEETAGIGEITEEETTAVVGETETAGTTGTEDTAVVPEEIITEEYGIDKTKQGSEADTEGHQ